MYGGHPGPGGDGGHHGTPLRRDPEKRLEGAAKVTEPVEAGIQEECCKNTIRPLTRRKDSTILLVYEKAGKKRSTYQAPAERTVRRLKDRPGMQVRKVALELKR